jgi:hypothetical protein
MWQKYPLLQGHGDPFSGIESGRISANRVQIKGIFHANHNGAVYGVSRKGAEPENRNPGPIRAYFGDGFPAAV